MDDADSVPAIPLSGLLCKETETNLDGDESDVCTLDNEIDDGCMQLLLDKEIAFFEIEKTEALSVLLGGWMECARLEAIQWILKTGESFGFRFQTAYLSVTYLDRFLSKRVIDIEKYWAIRLLSVACLSLAAKLEEIKAPVLSEFPVEDYNFESKVIQRMELLVLTTLEWRMTSVTPFTYIHYFVSRFSKESTPSNTVSRTIELIMATLNDVDFLSHRPSVVAGAATLVSLDKKLTKDALVFKINAMLPSGFLAIDDVFMCYGRMRELDLQKLMSPKCMRTPISSIIQQGKKDALESSITSASNTKRKRLRFNDVDQDDDFPDQKKQSEKKSNCSN